MDSEKDKIGIFDSSAVHAESGDGFDPVEEELAILSREIFYRDLRGLVTFSA